MTNTAKHTKHCPACGSNLKKWYEINRVYAAAPELLEACNTAILATLDNVVGNAIKDGSLLAEEMHAGLCLLGYIRRKYLKTYENAISKAKGA